VASLEEAIALAVQTHQNQTDRAGQPYILHPLRVMFRLDGDIEKIVGVLHDVVEDSDLTLADIRAMGYSEEIVAALDGVTRRDSETYAEFVERSRQNPISLRVKLADLEDNMDVRRLGDKPSKQDLERIARYRRAWGRLREPR
jgi:(p)ppGpp synthase/HD superfamily hydrolase